jgi:HD-like signal output (HDOD) protein
MLELLKIEHEAFTFFTRGFARLMESRKFRYIFVVLLNKNEYISFVKLQDHIREDTQSIFIILGEKELDRYVMHKNYEILYHNQLLRPFEQVLVANNLCLPLEMATNVQTNKESIFDYIKRILDKGDVVLPIKKDVAFQMLPILESDDVTLQEIASMSRMDPGIHAGLIKLSNTVHYSGFFTDIKDIETAIIRIGTLNIKMFLINYINKSLAANKDLLYHHDINEAVEESLQVASISNVLADVLKFSGKRIVFSIGMVHLIGYIFLLAILSDYLAEEKASKEDIESCRNLAKVNGINVGVALLKKWKFKQEFYQPVQYQDEPAKCKYQNEAKILKTSKVIYRYFKIEDTAQAGAYLKKMHVTLTASQLEQIKVNSEDFYKQTRLLFD